MKLLIIFLLGVLLQPLALFAAAPTIPLRKINHGCNKIMKYIILVVFFVFSPHLIAGTVPNSNAALIPIISYMLSGSASNITGTLDTTFNINGIAVYDSASVGGHTILGIQ